MQTQTDRRAALEQQLAAIEQIAANAGDLPDQIEQPEEIVPATERDAESAKAVVNDLFAALAAFNSRK